jgi:hypothetical protein
MLNKIKGQKINKKILLKHYSCVILKKFENYQRKKSKIFFYCFYAQKIKRINNLML